MTCVAVHAMRTNKLRRRQKTIQNLAYKPKDLATKLKSRSILSLVVQIMAAVSRAVL